ncbi:AI-2E family transporter [Thalassobaculum sp.]|uniref:AI-2E family transporter n=1 Tax=Thalassobaculum sp. TaxID=2022740 RepID=UPI003B5C7684
MSELQTSNPKPVHEQFGHAISSVVGDRRLLVPLWVMAAVATIFFFREAKPFLAPVIGSAVLAIALSPITRFLERSVGLSRGFAALISLVLAAGVVASVLWILIPAADNWQDRLGELTEQAERKLFPISSTIDEVKKATEKVGEAANLADGDQPKIVVDTDGSYLSQVLGGAPFVVIQILTTAIVSFFFLRERRWLLRSGIAFFATYRERYRMAQIAREIRRSVGSYFLIQITISAGVGLVTALSFYAIGMPAPATWGGAIAVANFVPFIGPFLIAALSFVGGLVTFDTLQMCLIPPAIVFAVNAVEENVVIPMVMSSRFYTSPVVIILAVLFGAWMWGTIGGVLAVPTAVIVLSALRRWRETEEMLEDEAIAEEVDD